MSQHVFQTDRIRTLIFCKKKPSVSDEEFSRYWLEEHSRVFMKHMGGKAGLIRYQQMHVNKRESARFKDMGVPVLEGYDGVVLFDLESFDQFTEHWSSPEYLSDVVPDEEKFCDRKSAILLRVKIASVFERDGESSTAGTISSPYHILEDRVRLFYVFRRKEGMTIEEMGKHWLEERTKLSLQKTQLGKEMIGWEQMHLAFPDPIVQFDESMSNPLPQWDGVALCDAPSFNSFLHPEDIKIRAEDNEKWLAPGTLLVLPVNIAKIIGKVTKPSHKE
ncbi:hypothetical protein VNI00_004604 [Paramarasmius palmivorus]|uniref:EthD domain-containing protein n=1 Tax=Paramarasmius palmivorus TaxID=297713 RepID=A0AAW0DK26_9AGAR